MAILMFLRIAKLFPAAVITLHILSNNARLPVHTFMLFSRSLTRAGNGQTGGRFSVTTAFSLHLLHTLGSLIVNELTVSASSPQEVSYWCIVFTNSSTALLFLPQDSFLRM